jgi:ArsR family transcriptional regulator, arsenate/arsenite/antimonite-responsive transcriptional repressor
MREFLTITNALADESRLRLLLCLSDRELCVCKLVELIGLADSTVSKHMSILRQAGLVESRKKGRWVYYRLANEEVSPLARKAIEFAREQLRGDKVVSSDAARIIEILSKDDGTACQQDAIPCSTNKPDAVSVTA